MKKLFPLLLITILFSQEKISDLQLPHYLDLKSIKKNNLKMNLRYFMSDIYDFFPPMRYDGIKSVEVKKRFFKNVFDEIVVCDSVIYEFVFDEKTKFIKSVKSYNDEKTEYQFDYGKNILSGWVYDRFGEKKLKIEYELLKNKIVEKKTHKDGVVFIDEYEFDKKGKLSKVDTKIKILIPKYDKNLRISEVLVGGYPSSSKMVEINLKYKKNNNEEIISLIDNWGDNFQLKYVDGYVTNINGNERYTYTCDRSELGVDVEYDFIYEFE